MNSFFIKRFVLLICIYSMAGLPDLIAQFGSIEGLCSSSEGVLEYCTIHISGTTLSTNTNIKGQFKIKKIPFGDYSIHASYLGFKSINRTITLSDDNEKLSLDFYFEERSMSLEEIVVSGTKTFKRQTDSPVIVNVMSSEALDNVQACNLSEGLKFQPGLRVETDCQTCNYTQLRMNGLGGGYSQILINGRPIFSPLTGLYGMEQLPVSMIDRVEVIRGGGSSLYGSSAIGGTVNVITKIPKKNSYELNYNFQEINNQTPDHQTTANATVVAPNKNSGVSIFLNQRSREMYDHNEDNFSEIPKIENTSFGINMFLLPSDNQKLELSLSKLNEYRFGGEIFEGEAHLAEQSEERTHDVWMGSVDYQLNFNDYNSSLIFYGAWSNTSRDHYTGIKPDGGVELQDHLESPPYGVSDVSTYNIGIQLNHLTNEFITGVNTFTLGAEYVYDDVYDNIPSYNYLIDQTTKDLGLFLQSDWEFMPSLSLLTGVRMDKHNLVDGLVFSPRASLLYKYKNYTQIRFNYGSGFRAPQAFDADLHIAFAGGGISRVSLSPDLSPENSQSLSASINFDKPVENYIYGFTLEGFHTRLNDAFYLEPIGEDAFGELFEKRNGQGATVQGITVELRANYNRKIQLESGWTLQSSRFDQTVQYIDELEGIKDFVRTPNNYGFTTLSFTPNNRFSVNLNYVFTGSMIVPHFGGAPNQLTDEIIDTQSFSELSLKLAYEFDIKALNSKIEFYTGVKNITNAYQSQFDIGKNRDSNFVYGPAQPRTIYFGFKLRT